MNTRVLETASRTDPGRVRQFNEDSIVVDAQRGIAALADGMAARKGAEIASRLATSRLLDTLRGHNSAPPDRAVHVGFAAANQAIVAQAEADPALRGMGSTLVAAWFRGDRVWIANVGDSRVYRFRGGELERMTTDHSFVQEQLAAGMLTEDEVRRSQSRHLVTRVLGTMGELAPDLSEHKVEVGDVYLLCSDGLHDLVDDTGIALVLEALEPNLELAATTLIAMANDYGGRDNVSVVLVKVKCRERAAQSAATRRARTTDHHSTPGLLGWLRSRLGR